MRKFSARIINFLFSAFLCISVSGYSSTDTPNKKHKILVGSPVCQKPAILLQFLESFKRLDRENYTLDYCFVDDNTIIESSQLLHNFQPLENECVEVICGKTITTHSKKTNYICNETTHLWDESLIWKVAAFKDRIIQLAKEKQYDYLFLVDSDIVLHPKTITQLIQADKDIVSNIFWTQWSPDQEPLPQVWLLDQYTLYFHEIGENLSTDEIQKRQTRFLQLLRYPGTFEVGGLGACTLLSAHALQKSVSFQRIKNLTLWGEDRHFCVRASAMGLSLFVDTHYPAFHIYRESELPKVPLFIDSCNQIRVKQELCE